MGEASQQLDELVQRATAGDRSSLESLLIHYHDPLLRLIGRSVPPDGCAAEDILQETFIQVFRSIRTLEPRGSAAFFSWLKTIARTRLVNRLKSQRAQKRGGDRSKNDETATSILKLIASDQPGAATIVRRGEALAALAKALTELDPDKRLILELRYGQQMTVVEIAAKVGKNEGAVKMVINRSIKELRNELEKLGDFTTGV